jgi:hypothetical protein
MAKFSSSRARPNVFHVVRTTGARGPTHEGGDGYERDAKSELFLLAVSNFVSETTFYESASDRDDRFEHLLAKVTAEDPDWVRRMIPWLRNEAQMRSASLVAAAEYVKAGGVLGRQVVSAALERADEPAEMLAYWHQRHGRRVPKPVKRGVADAVVRLYNERAALKYDGHAKVWRMADVIELVHPQPRDGKQSALFKYLLDKRHDRVGDLPDELGLIGLAQQVVQRIAAGEDVPATDIASAGISWERQSGATQMDAAGWQRQIPSMGYMALLRNLRNFDQAGISDESAQLVISKLANADEVAKSRQFPMRFLSAYKAVESERWKPALEKAAELSMVNVPRLGGKTLVLVDVSGSMVSAMSGRSELQRWEVAGTFGAAIATRAENADLYAYSSTHSGGAIRRGRGFARLGANADRKQQIDFGAGASVFTVLSRIRGSRCFNGGTQTWQTVAETYAGHDRVFILTDEQSFSGGSDPGPDAIPLIYTWNLGGYLPAHNQSGERGRYSFGGLTDRSFAAVPLLEAAKDGTWPF